MSLGMAAERDELDSKIGDLVKRDPSAKETLEKLADLGAELVSVIPGVGIAIKVAAWTGGWYFDAKKIDRVFPVLVGLRGQQAKIEREYVQKAEFDDLLHEGLRRLSEQPDDARRADLRNIILKITREPRRHDEHLMFIRLADELPLEALRVLAAVHEPLQTRAGFAQQADAVLQKRAEVVPDQIGFWMEFLANQGLFDRTRFQEVVQSGRPLGYLLTPLGEKFERYRRE